MFITGMIAIGFAAGVLLTIVLLTLGGLKRTQHTEREYRTDTEREYRTFITEKMKEMVLLGARIAKGRLEEKEGPTEDQTEFAWTDTAEGSGEPFVAHMPGFIKTDDLAPGSGER